MRALVLLAALVCASPAWAATYYVDAGCGNVATYVPATRACTGGSATVRTTLSGGSALMSSSGGDLLYIRAGTYAGASNVQIPLGTSGAYNTIKIYPGDSVVTFTTRFPWRTGNPLSPGNYVEWDGSGGSSTYGFVVDGLDAAGGWIDGISINQGPHHLRFRNIEIKRFASNGFAVSGHDDSSNTTGPGDNIELINSLVRDGGTTEFDNAIYIADNADHATIDGVTVTNYSGACIQFKSNLQSETTNIARSNVCHHTSGGGARTSMTEAACAAADSECANHVADNINRVQGIIFQKCSPGCQGYNNLIYKLPNATSNRYGIGVQCGSDGTEIFNNTIVNSPEQTGIEVYCPGDPPLAVVKNNVIEDNGGYEGNIYDEGGSTFDNNACDSAGTGCEHVSGSSFGFVNEAGDNYKLAAGSFLLDKGTTGSFATDFEGQTRTGTWDLGYDELDAASSDPNRPRLR